MLAPPFLQHENEPPKEGNISLEISSLPSSNSSDPVLDLDASKAPLKVDPDEYVQFQLRIFRAIISTSVFAVVFSAIFFDLKTSISLLVGALLGLLYLRLLARSIGKLGQGSKQVGKIQLIIPVLLVLASTKLPQLDLIPSLLGFLLYKPSLILQMLLESRA